MKPDIVIIGGGAGGWSWPPRSGAGWISAARPTSSWLTAAPPISGSHCFHEVATGAMDSSVDQISYRAVARYRHFRFVLGEFSGLDRQNQTITLNAILDEDGNTVLPSASSATTTWCWRWAASPMISGFPA